MAQVSCRRRCGVGKRSRMGSATLGAEESEGDDAAAFAHTVWVISAGSSAEARDGGVRRWCDRRAFGDLAHGVAEGGGVGLPVDGGGADGDVADVDVAERVRQWCRRR